MQKLNIDECYVALISRYIGYESKPNKMVLINSYKVKFTVVKYEGFGKYKDIISDEKYSTGANEWSKIGELFVNEGYLFLPLNSLMKLDNKFISKKKLLELIREPLIKLTKLLYTEERAKINHFETIIDIFSEVNDKQKTLNNLNIRRSKR